MPTIGRPDYEARRQARIDSLRARAEKKATDSQAAAAQASAIAGMIPFGQPIISGHHSEGRHRRDLDRIHGLHGKAIEVGREAQDLAARADAAEESTAISSDDPEALTKLRAKLANIEGQRELSAKINKAIRSARGDMDKAREALLGLGVAQDRAFVLLTPDCFGNLGVAPYRMTNWASEARRLKQRIAQLEAREAAPAMPDQQIGEVQIVERDNRVQLIFPGKPSDSVRAELKRNGFRWAPSEGAWQRMASPQAWYLAKQIAASVLP